VDARRCKILTRNHPTQIRNLQDENGTASEKTQRRVTKKKEKKKSPLPSQKSKKEAETDQKMKKGLLKNLNMLRSRKRLTINLHNKKYVNLRRGKRSERSRWFEKGGGASRA